MELGHRCSPPPSHILKCKGQAPICSSCRCRPTTGSALGPVVVVVGGPRIANARWILTSPFGRSSASVATSPILCITPIPEYTRPNIVCFPSSHGHGFSDTKNCDPFVFGPEFAIDTTPAPVCLRLRVISSSNLPPYTLSPPRPVPVGSPPWIMNPLMMRWKIVLS